MGPVADVELAVLAHDDVARVAVAVADLELLLHAVQARHEVVAGGGVDVLEAVDHTGVLVTLTVEQRGALGVNLDLQVDELLE